MAQMTPMQIAAILLGWKRRATKMLKVVSWIKK